MRFSRHLSGRRFLPGTVPRGAPLARARADGSSAPRSGSARLPQGDIRARRRLGPSCKPRLSFRPLPRPLGVSGSSPWPGSSSLALAPRCPLLLPAGFQACFVCDAVVPQRTLRPQGRSEPAPGPLRPGSRTGERG